MSMANFTPIFEPQAIAVVGATSREGSVGQGVMANLAGSFTGQLYPINPEHAAVNGLTCYPTLTAVGAPIDLAVIIVPAALVPQILTEAGALGIKGAIVISAGFKEAGHKDLEEQLQEISARYGITLIGPNCLGVINPARHLNASFASLLPDNGPVAFISQSGAICTGIIDCARSMGIGFSKFISVGNKAVVDDAALWEYLATDDATQVIAMYAEQLSDTRRLLPLAKKITRGASAKPIIVLKSGRTTAGAGATASHTGALAGNDAAYDALFRQAGIIRADTITELFDYIKIFSTNKLAPARRLAIITNAGGPGALAVDAAIHDGLAIAVPAAETTAALKAALPPAANIHNPIDVLGDARFDRYQAALTAVAADPAIDSLLVILTPQTMTEIERTAESIVKLHQTSAKPLAVSFIGEQLVAAGRQIMQAGGVAVYDYPEAAIKALAQLANLSEKAGLIDEPAPELADIDRAAVSKIFAQARAAGVLTFPEASGLAILKAYGFPLLDSRIAHNRAEAEQIAKEIGRPLVLKIVSPDILHKTEAGGIVLNVLPENAGTAFEALWSQVAQKQPQAHLEGVLLEELVSGGTEMILGSVQDPSLGAALMLGFGGTAVEVWRDIVFGVNPLTKTDVLEMIKKLRAYKLLAGWRGAPAADQAALVDGVLRLARLLADFPEIKEMDINPFLVLEQGKGAKALDVRIVIA
jgi:acetyltransferase